MICPGSIGQLEQSSFHLEAGYTHKGPQHSFRVQKEQRWGVGLEAGEEGEGLSSMPSLSLKLNCSLQGKKGLSPERSQRGRVDVVLPQPLFWARPMSGSLSCFLPDSPPVRHGVASLVSHVSCVLPQLHMNGDHRLKLEGLGVGVGW